MRRRRCWTSSTCGRGRTHRPSCALSGCTPPNGWISTVWTLSPKEPEAQSSGAPPTVCTIWTRNCLREGKTRRNRPLRTPGRSALQSGARVLAGPHSGVTAEGGGHDLPCLPRRGCASLHLRYPRYSEDLDFTRELHAERYDLHSYLSTIESRFSAEGYQTSTKAADARPVHSAWIRFPGLLYELRLSPHPVETMSIKIEIDTNPPKGAVTTTTTVRRHVLLRLHHHDRATLLAGKINAILTRPYLKGRDVYDLVWYLSDPGQPPPNLKLLNNALRQFGWFREGGETVTDDITDHNWRHLLLDQFKETNWAYVVDDVRPLLEDQTEVELLALDTVQELVRGGARGR